MKPARLPIVAQRRALETMVEVKWRANALIAGPLQVRHVRAGLTIEEIALSLRRDLPEALFRQRQVSCWVGPHRVDRAIWHLVRPRGGVEVIFAPDLRGGGANFKTFASLALIVAAIAITQGAASFAAPELITSTFWSSGTYLAAGSTSAQLLAAGVLIGGNVAMSLLAPAVNGATDGPVEDNTGKAASLSGNVLIPGSAAPRVLGTRRVFPPLICSPLNEVVDGNAYAEAVYVLGGTHAISVPRAGDVLLTDFADGEVEYEAREGPLRDPTIQSIVTRHSHTRTYGTELPRHVVDKVSSYKLAGTTIDKSNVTSAVIARQLPSWQSFTSKSIDGDIDEIWLVPVFPEGLGNNETATEYVFAPVRVRFRKRGDSTWINCPEILFCGKTAAPRTHQIKFIWGTAPAAGSRCLNTGNVDTGSARVAFATDGPSVLLTSVPTQDIAPIGAGGWTASSYFLNGTGSVDYFMHGNANYVSGAGSTKVANADLTRDNVLFYLDAVTHPKGDYEFQVMAGAGIRQTAFSASGYSYTGADNSGASGIYDFFTYTTQGGANRVPNEQGKLRSRVAIARVSSIINDNPLQVNDFAHMAVRVKNRSLDAFSVLASGFVYDYNSGTGLWDTLTTTSNPAAHLRDVMTGTLTGRSIPDDLIDDADFIAFRARNVADGWAVNLLADGKSADDVCRELVGSCLAMLRQSEKFGVWYDRDRSAEGIVQTFTPRNIQNFSFENVIPDRPSGYRVRCDDATDNYKEKEHTVLDPYSVSPSNPLQDLRLDGVTDPTVAQAIALYNLKASYWRQTLYSFEADAEQYVCRRGSLIGVNHDVLTQAMGFGRVGEVLVSGGLVVGIVVDAEAYHGNGFFDPQDFFVPNDFFTESFGVVVRLDNGSTITKSGTTSDSGLTIMFDTPFAMPAGGISVGNLVATGTIDHVYERMIIVAITPKADLLADIVCVPEAPEIFGVESGYDYSYEALLTEG